MKALSWRHALRALLSIPSSPRSHHLLLPDLLPYSLKSSATSKTFPRYPRHFSSSKDDHEGSKDDDSSKSKSALLHSLQRLTDEEVVQCVNEGKISQYRLEQELKHAIEAGYHPDCERAVRIRRIWLQQRVREAAKRAGKKVDHDGASPLEIDEELSSQGLPYTRFDSYNFYQEVLGKNCENVIGYVPIPVGFVGPLLLNGVEYNVPLATTEGALLASTNRGCRAITQSGGAESFVFKNGMTRAPVLRFSSAGAAAQAKAWVDEPQNFEELKAAFESTTRFGKLQRIEVSLAGRQLYLRFVCSTGDAMGMNMVSKGCLQALELLKQRLPDAAFDVMAISGNVCIDKKPSGINWINGRGRSVVAEVTLTKQVVEDVLKCTVNSLVELNVAKNLVGSAIAASVGGNNAHASNIVTALFIATGQDPAQNVESSTCMTLFEPINEGQDVHVSVTMPSIEVGTVGGGTGLPAQWACLEMLGVAGASEEAPGENASELARVVAATVLAGEISLMSALASNHLVSAHMKLNR